MTSEKKILIVDEDGFSRVCSAILKDEGYQTRLAESSEEALRFVSGDGISLIVSSCPFALAFLDSKTVREIPIIVLSDEVNSDLMEMMKRARNSVCLVKPLDFERFKYIVRGIVNGYLNLTGGNIIA
ncbi:MAG: DNA-binding response regulator [Nitrospiraceae bacterium]|nr:MAG: DNA-binding response regulator [Nitrospiraceae bacterium]